MLCGLVACQENNRLCVIEGTLPGTSYDGEKVYIVPLRNVTDDRVDSVTITNGAFHMERQVPADELYILRTRPVLRLSLQELLIVVEPGTIAVRIDSISSAGGTPQNDALQQWKEHKAKSDDALLLLNQMLKADGDTTVIRQRMRELQAEMDDFTFRIIKANPDNAVGTFFYSMSASRFTPEQKQVLLERSE